MSEFQLISEIPKSAKCKFGNMKKQSETNKNKTMILFQKVLNATFGWVLNYEKTSKT